MTEEIVYEVEVNREPAFDGKNVKFWIQKLWTNTELKVRGSKLNAGFTIFPRGQLPIAFEVEDDVQEDLSPKQLAEILEESINVLTKPYRAFVRLEDSQDEIRDKEQF